VWGEREVKLLPASLAARTVLLVIAVIVVAELATFSLIGQSRRTAHMKQTVQFVAGQVHLLQRVLPGLDSDARHRLSTVEPGEHGLQLRADGPGVPRHEPRFGFAHRLAEELNARLDSPVSLRHAGLGQRSGLWIGFAAGGETWWLILPPPRFEPQALPSELWVGLAVTLAILLLIASLFVRSIVGPLARLGAAVTATGDGSARPVIPEGPAEVRRLAERHNNMLVQLAQADSERREMLAGLTHDLRAPLARLRVRLALLENDIDRAGLTRDADDMERIVAQCLIFLRSEESELATPSPLLIADAVSNEVARHCELGRAVTLTVSEDVVPIQIALAPVNLQRLLDNLIDNALRHGAPPVEVSLAIEGGQTVRLEVRDHGPGIPAHEREHALRAFGQIEPARATGGSCGLGLAIVRRIIAAGAGNLVLADAPEGGLLVTVRLPAIHGRA
jgi:two-component system osmolarity sensor histidine kinase EnvZ